MAPLDHPEGSGRGEKIPLEKHLEQLILYAEQIIRLAESHAISFADSPDPKRRSQNASEYDSFSGPQLLGELQHLLATAREVKERLAANPAGQELIEADHDGEIIEQELPILLEALEARREGSTKSH